MHFFSVLGGLRWLLARFRFVINFNWLEKTHPKLRLYHRGGIAGRRWRPLDLRESLTGRRGLEDYRRVAVENVRQVGVDLSSGLDFSVVEQRTLAFMAAEAERLGERLFPDANPTESHRPSDTPPPEARHRHPAGMVYDSAADRILLQTQHNPYVGSELVYFDLALNSWETRRVETQEESDRITAIRYGLENHFVPACAKTAASIEKQPHPDAGKAVKPPRKIRRTVAGVLVEHIREKDGNIGIRAESSGKLETNFNSKEKRNDADSAREVAVYQPGARRRRSTRTCAGP